MKPQPLVKELLKPGVYTGQNGATSDIDAAEIERILEDTLRLKELGWKFHGWDDHFKGGSSEILGEWSEFWIDGQSLFGLFRPWSLEARDVALATDASVFVPGDLQLGEHKFTDAITRVDIVAQGAVYDAGPFIPAEVFFASQPQDLRARLAASQVPTSQGRRLNLSALKGKEYCPMLSRVMRAFAAAFSFPLDPEGEFPADKFDEQVLSAMGFEPDVTDEELLAALEEKLFAAPAAPAEAPEKPEAALAPPADDPAAPANDEMAEMQNEMVEEMIEERLMSAGTIDPADIETVRAVFSAHRPRGFRFAFAAAKAQAGLVARASGLEGSAATPGRTAPGTRAFSRVPRPDPKAAAGQAAEKAQPLVESFKRRLARTGGKLPR